MQWQYARADALVSNRLIYRYTTYIYIYICNPITNERKQSIRTKNCKLSGYTQHIYIYRACALRSYCGTSPVPMNVNTNTKSHCIASHGYKVCRYTFTGSRLSLSYALCCVQRRKIRSCVTKLKGRYAPKFFKNCIFMVCMFIRRTHCVRVRVHPYEKPRHHF